MNKKKGILLTVLAFVSLVVITVGVTYAFFNYAKEGSTENSVTTGTITFLYTEVSGVGRGIGIRDAYPISDTVGKAQTGEGNVFDFKVTSNTPNKTSIPYEVTARKKSDSTLDESAVKLYLTKVTGDNEEEVLLSKYSELVQTSKVDASTYTEKTIYTGKVPANSMNYEQAFRLRIWIDEDTNFSPNSDGTYPYNGKTFTVTVNVYANAKVVTDSDIVLESNTNISSLSVGDTVLTPVDGKDYDYETTLPEGTTSTTINVETENPYATVSIERIDSLAYQESNIKRLSTKKTVELNPGDNYFKITVTSENKEVENEYKIKISVEKELEGFAKIIYESSIIGTDTPNLRTKYSGTGKLYKTVDTDSGDPIYYYRGNVTNNWVKFAGFNWRVVRINEDGTIKLIMQDGINSNSVYSYNTTQYDTSVTNARKYMYYSNSNAKTQLNTWYSNYIIKKGYSNYVASGKYYCEQAKVAGSSGNTNTNYNGTVIKLYSDTSYIPTFKCSSDGNGKGIVSSNVGLLSYDEVVFAGGYPDVANTSYFLYNSAITWWTMSPAGIWYSNPNYFPYAFPVYKTGKIYINNYSVAEKYSLRPVINIYPNVIITGSGTSTDPYVVQ